MIKANAIKVLNALRSGLFVLFKNKTVKRVTVSALTFVFIFSVFMSVLAVTDLTYAVEVNVKGESCGYVTDLETVDKAVDSLNNISVQEDKSFSSPKVDCSFAVVPSSQLISSSQLADNIVLNDSNVYKVACVIVNGVTFAKVDSVEAGETALAEISGGNRFYNTVEVKECLLSFEGKSRLKKLKDCLSDTLTTTLNYLTQKGDTKESIAARFNLSVEAIPDFICGDEIELSANLPAFAFVNEEEFSTKKSVPATKSNNSGWEVTVYKNVYVGGVKVNTKEVGTHFSEKFPNKPKATKIVSAGKKGYCWPVDTGYRQYISSFWGDERDHEGYDIAASVGTPILNVYGGKVVSVNASGEGYGLHFVIDHGNGVKTLYAHCSKLYVSVGDRVERGEVVALVGATGRVTGPHLHFEVYKNGVRVDPYSYIGSR